MTETSKTPQVAPKQIWSSGTGTVRIMAVTEGWIMLRYKGASPFCCYITDFLNEFTYRESL